MSTILASLFLVGLSAQTASDTPAEPSVDAPALSSAAASELPKPSSDSGFVARRSAHLLPKGAWSVGVFNPLRYGLSDNIELETAPLTTLLGAPNLIARVRHWRSAKASSSAWTLTGEYGLSSPTLAIKFLQNAPTGALFVPNMTVQGGPNEGQSEGSVGFWLVPRAGLLLSRGEATGNVFTLRADVAVGLPLSHSDLPPSLTGWAPFSLLMAPVQRTFRARLGAAYDAHLMPRLRIRAMLNGYILGNSLAGGPEHSPFVLEAYAGADWSFGGGARRITAGAKWYNWDQRQQVVELDADGYGVRRYVRSNDFFPTIDYIWTF